MFVPGFVRLLALLLLPAVVSAAQTTRSITLESGGFRIDSSSITLGSDGKASREFHRYDTRSDERSTGTVNAPEYQALADLLTEVDFWGMKDVYSDPRMADGSQLTVHAVKADGTKKSVTDSNGQGPPGLKKVITLFNTTASRIAWHTTPAAAPPKAAAAPDYYGCAQDRDCAIASGACGEQVCVNRIHVDYFNEMNQDTRCLRAPPPPRVIVPFCANRKCSCAEDDSWKKAPAGGSEKWFACAEASDCSVVERPYTCEYVGINRRYDLVFAKFLPLKDPKAQGKIDWGTPGPKTAEEMTAKMNQVLDERSPECPRVAPPDARCERGRCSPTYSP